MGTGEMGSDMKDLFAGRLKGAKRSFLDHILKVAERPDMISFAGGLPGPECFPVAALAKVAARALRQQGSQALQYQSTEGYLPLREYIAARYQERWGIEARPEEILLTTGSQQALDLLGKAFLERGDKVVLERPAYVGAIEAFGMYEPEMAQVEITDEGLDVRQLEAAVSSGRVKMVYTVPNFQNPSGRTYSAGNRVAVAEAAKSCGAVLVEDDPYHDIRFEGEDLEPLAKSAGEDCVMLGTFSKTVAPGLRVGWVLARGETFEKLVIAKQAADLHSDSFTQRMLHEYLTRSDVEGHIDMIRRTYRARRDAMMQAIREHCGEEVRHTRPEGGMFLWMTLPEGVSAMGLFESAIKENVAFVPGRAFYVGEGGENAMRLNFSNSDEQRIREGIKRLGKVLKEAVAAGRA